MRLRRDRSCTFVLAAGGWTSDILGAVRRLRSYRWNSWMRACICALAVRADRGSCMYIHTRDAGLEVEVEGEGLGDFRMPGLVDGTVVPGPLPSAFSRRAYMYSEA